MGSLSSEHVNIIFDKLFTMNDKAVPVVDNGTGYDYILTNGNDSGSSMGLVDSHKFLEDTRSIGNDWTEANNISAYIIPSPAAQLLSQSLWNIFDERYLRHSLGWTITLIVAYVLILITGIIGNCMVILVVVRRPQMRSVTNMFIMNLAVADLFVIVFCVPATLLSNIFTPWILGSFMCKGVAYVQGVSVCASAYSLAAISLDRCKAIYRPLERPRSVSKSQALSTICVIWLLALLLIIPWAVIFDVITSEKDGLPYCVEMWANQQHGKVYFLVGNLIFCYSLPLLLITLSNGVILCHVFNRKVPQDSASEGPIKRIHKRTRHGVRKMLGIVTLAFGFSWLPLYVLVCRVKFAQDIGQFESSVLRVLMPFAQWLGSWNSCINPVLYAFLNSKFREMFKSLLPEWMPFIRRNEIHVNKNHALCRTISNGTHVCTNGTPSHSTMYIARSSAKSTNYSHRVHRLSQCHQKKLVVNNFQGNSTGTATTVVSTVPLATTSPTSGFGNGGNYVSNTTIASRTIANL